MATIKPSNTTAATTKTNTTTHQAVAHRTLGGLLRYFEGMPVAVELKTGKIYQGRLAAADQDLTVTLDDCTVTATVPPTPPSLLQHQRPSKKQRTDPGSDDNNSRRSTTPSDPQPSAQTFLHAVQIRGSLVRYIHFLDHQQANLAAVVQRGLDRERSAAQKYKRGVRK